MHLSEWIGKLLVLASASVATIQLPDNTICNVKQAFANCSSFGLTHLPLDLPSSIVALDASDNHLSQLEWPLPYSHLVTLNVSRNSIQRLSFQTFNHLFSLNILDLSHNKIRYLMDLDSNVTFFRTPQLVQLILTGNPLKALGMDPIRSDSLRLLDLSECDVRLLDGETSLMLMPSLKIIILDRNPLTKLDILKSDSLEELYLVETQLRYINNKLYTDLPRLEILDLSRNSYLRSLSRVGSINSSSLRILKAEFCSLEYVQIRGLPQLEHLYLKGNRIDRISSGEFEFSGKLLTVDLSMNWIHQLDSTGFYGAVNLVQMDLSENKIFELGRSLSPLIRLVHLNVSENSLFTLDGVEEALVLTVLDASHCELTSLPSNLFTMKPFELVNLSRNSIWILPTGMSSFTLIDLDLRYNRLTEVDDSWFKHFPRLKHLRLDGNRLTEPFHPDTLRRLGHVTLHLDDNPWKCNCAELRYRNFYTHLSVKNNLNSLTCHGPQNVTGLTWKEACFPVDTVEASVKGSGKNAWIPMVVSAFTTFAIVFLIYFLKKRNMEEAEARQTNSQTIREPTHIPRSPPRFETQLPTYEEAILMPKPKQPRKSNADTQTHVSFLGSARSLDSRSKHALLNSPSSNSL